MVAFAAETEVQAIVPHPLALQARTDSRVRHQVGGELTCVCIRPFFSYSFRCSDRSPVRTRSNFSGTIWISYWSS